MSKSRRHSRVWFDDDSSDDTEYNRGKKFSERRQDRKRKQTEVQRYIDPVIDDEGDY